VRDPASDAPLTTQVLCDGCDRAIDLVTSGKARIVTERKCADFYLCARCLETIEEFSPRNWPRYWRSKTNA